MQAIKPFAGSRRQSLVSLAPSDSTVDDEDEDGEVDTEQVQHIRTPFRQRRPSHEVTTPVFDVALASFGGVKAVQSVIHAQIPNHKAALVGAATDVQEAKKNKETTKFLIFNPSAPLLIPDFSALYHRQADAVMGDVNLKRTESARSGAGIMAPDWFASRRWKSCPK